MYGKKIFGSLISAVLILSVSVSVSAKEVPKAKVTFEKAAINDLKVLRERALKGIGDKPEILPKATEGQLKNTENGLKVSTEVYHTAQKLKEIENSDGSTEETYSVTYFTDATNASLLSTASSNDISAWDPTGGVIAYSTFNYTYTQGSGTNVYYHLNYVSGGWSIEDPTYIHGTKTVNYGNSGYPITGGIAISQSINNVHPTSLTFSYNAPSSWVSIYKAGMVIGLNQNIVIKRGSSTWEFYLPNQLIF